MSPDHVPGRPPAQPVPKCEVRDCAVGRGVFATAPIAPGEPVVDLCPVFDERPGRHTIQLADSRHQAFTGDMDDFVNHCCRPNCFLDADGLRLVALTSIAPGQEITLNYLASEWDMVEPFVCDCDGTERTIRGFRHLSGAEQAELEGLVPEWLWARRKTLDAGPGGR